MSHRLSQVSTSRRKPLEALSTNLRLPTLTDTASSVSTTLPPVKVLLAKYGLPEDDDEYIHAWLQRRFIAENRHPTNASPTSSNLSSVSSTIPHSPGIPSAEYVSPYNEDKLSQKSSPRKLLEDKKAPNIPSALSKTLSHTPSASRPPAGKLLRTYGLPDNDDEPIYPWLYQKTLEDSKDIVGTSTKARPSVFNDDEDSDISLKSFKTILASSKRKQRRESTGEEADLRVTGKRRRPSTTNINRLRVDRRLRDVPPSTIKLDARRASNKESTYDGVDLIRIAGDNVLNTRLRRRRTSAVSYALPELELPEETQEERRKAQRLYEIDNATDSGEEFHSSNNSFFSNEAADVVRESEVDTESNNLSKSPGSPFQGSYGSSGELRDSVNDQGVVIPIVEPDNIPSKVIAKRVHKSRKIPPAKHVGVAVNGNGRPTKAKNHRAAQRPATHRPRDVSVFTPTLLPVTKTFDDLRAFQTSLLQTRVIQWRCRDLVEPAGLMATLDRPKVRDCILQNVTRASGQGRWSMTVKPRTNDVGSLAKPLKGYITFTFPDSRYDEPLVHAAVPALKHLIDRWPMPIQWNPKDRSLRAWSAAFLNAATEIAQKDFDEKVEFRAHKVMYFIDCYHIDIPFFDSEDGTMQLYRESINPSSMTNLQIPDVPGHYRFDKYTNQRRSESQKPLRIARRPEGSAEIARHEASEKLCKLLYFKLYGKIASKATMARLACEELARLSIRRRYKKNGTYGGVRLYSTCLLRRAGCVRFRPSWWLQRDVEGYIPEITLLSLRAAQILQVEGAIDEAWARSGNPLTAWETGATEAFLLNEKLLSDALTSYCNCTEFEALTTLHVCQQCRRMTVCSTLLVDDYGNNICAQCDEEQQKDTQFARYIMSRNADTSLDKSHEEYRAYVNFHRRQYEECGMLQISKSDTSLQAETWDRFRETHCVLQDGKILIRDVYTGALRQVVPPRRDRKSKRKQPFVVSFDGWFPYVFHQSRIRYHVSENIVPVALYINYLKWTFVPAMLQILVDYRGQTTKDTEAFVKDMDGIQAIALQIAHRKKLRLQQADHLTEAELLKRMEIDNQEWVSGRPREFGLREEALISRLSRHCFGKYSEEDSMECELGWNAKDIGRMEHVIAEIEGVFGRKVARSPADNAPWPFHEYSMPNHWCWPLLWKLFKTRLTRMTIACNRKYETVDNEETLLLQCIIQRLDPEHKEFLGLPLVPFIRHPLKFSVAHKHHGRQMRTGFKTIHPLSLDDYDSVLSNILFETWLSNAMKLDFDEDLYDAMLADLDTINLGRDSYDPDMARVRGMEDDGDFTLMERGEWEIEEDDMEAEYEEEAGGADKVGHYAVRLVFKTLILLLTFVLGGGLLR